MTKIKIKRVMSKFLIHGDFVIIRGELCKVFRGKTWLHKHGYIQIEFKHYGLGRKIYDYEEVEFDKIIIEV